MSIDKSILTIKQFKQIFSEIKRDYAKQGVVDCSVGAPIYQALLARLEEKPAFILEEIAALVIKEVNKADARFDFEKNQGDFFAYGDKWIILPEEKTVRVYEASLDHVRFQAQTVLDEHVKKMKAFVTHYDGLLMPIIRTMEIKNLKAAGQAIEILGKGAH